MFRKSVLTVVFRRLRSRLGAEYSAVLDATFEDDLFLKSFYEDIVSLWKEKKPEENTDLSLILFIIANFDEIVEMFKLLAELITKLKDK